MLSRSEFSLQLWGGQEKGIRVWCFLHSILTLLVLPTASFFFFTFLLHRFPADISDVDCEVQHREAIHSVKGDLSAP